MSLADQLLSDISDGSDEEIDGEENGIENLALNGSSGVAQHDFDYLITITSLSDIKSVRPYCPVLPRLEAIVSLLNRNDVRPDNDSLLSDTNGVLDKARDSITSVYNFIKVNYKPVWQDLDGLIRNPVNFARIISIVRDDVTNVQNITDQLGDFLKKDEILGLTMSASVMRQADESGIKLSGHHIDLVVEACGILLELDAGRSKIRSFLSKQAYNLAPNITAIVGPEVCAQLLAVYGLEGLCKTPACNLPSLGVNNSAVGELHSGIKNQGYLYRCDLVQSVPEEYRKQAMRQISAKVALASRIDYSTRISDTKDDLFGNKWHDEIASKLEKLQAPPENQRIKPLPKPVDQKSTKRGGRRFRKQKERMQMSEIEKAQNRMVFGEREETRMDASGEEIGLGMAGKFSSGGSYRSLNVSEAHKPQVTKEMAKKLSSFEASNRIGGQGSNLSRLLHQDERVNRYKRKEISEGSSTDWLTTHTVKSDQDRKVKRIKRI
ncbi:DEKNAAC102259 [Brettanomyces naardenensis]|uniref:DEKNAAC102259 n=1 Tax=Brettanomyces naardenensis TaxID=13370 RepID=A0A448YKY0_BRENA|nr:DEKNAAC102259 [Brettanomyces naardenensis]